jgi:hypothetical protein
MNFIYWIFFSDGGDNSATFCDVTRCTLVEFYQRFREAYCFRPQNRRTILVSSHYVFCSLHVDSFLGLLSEHEDGDSKFLRDFTGSVPENNIHEDLYTLCP